VDADTITFRELQTMIIKVDVKYMLDKVYGEEFPLSPATLFQAMVNYNHHQLEQATPIL
jgi:hypothetical protein